MKAKEKTKSKQKEQAVSESYDDRFEKTNEVRLFRRQVSSWMTSGGKLRDQQRSAAIDLVDFW